MFSIEVEATNVCNTHCLHCPREAMSRPAGRMDWDTYETIIRKVKEFTRGEKFLISYSGMGEPFLNPLLYKFIETVSPYAETSFATNGSAVTPRNIQSLIQAGLDSIWFSFNGDEEEIYGKMMGGISYDQVCRNIRSAVDLSKNTSLKIGANVSVTRANQDRISKIKHALNEMGITSILYSKCHNRGGNLEDEEICDTPPIPFFTQRCDIFASTVFVDWRGKVLSCCHDLSAETEMGDLRIDSLDTIMARRQEIAQKGLDFRICAGCNDLYRLHADPLPDGKSLQDWIYALYEQDEGSRVDQYSILFRWLSEIYQREGKTERMFTQLTGEIPALKNEISQKENRIAELEAEMSGIRSSRTWKILDRFKRFEIRVISEARKIRIL